MVIPQLHPEVEHLRQAYEQNRIELCACLEEWHRLTVEVRPTLLEKYDKAFGEIEQERQLLSLQNTELFRRIELLSIKVQRGEQLTAETIEFVNKVVDAEYARLRSRLQGEEKAKHETVAPLQSVGYSELTQMYRTLAKQVHPDASGDNDRIKQWHQVREAYANRDVSRLQALCTALGANRLANDVTAEWDLNTWQEEAHRMSVRCRVEHRKLERLRSEAPFCMAKELDDPEWVSDHRTMLEYEVAKSRKELTEQRQIYRELIQGKCTPESNPAVSSEETAFNQDFMDSTYFGNR